MEYEHDDDASVLDQHQHLLLQEIVIDFEAVDFFASFVTISGGFLRLLECMLLTLCGCFVAAQMQKI